MDATTWNPFDYRASWKQIKALTWANLKSRYRKTVAGFLWVVLNPLIMYVVQSIIFTKVLKMTVQNYYLFLLSGLLPWIFIQQSMEMGTTLFIAYRPLLKALPANPFVYLSSQLLDNFINFVAAFIIILIPVCYLQDSPMFGLLFLPIPMLVMCLGTTGLVWILATTQVFFRDTRFIISFVLSISYFMTPIFYPPEYVPESFRWMVKINPLYIMILPFRVCIYDFSFAAFWNALWPAVILSVALFWMAAALWKWKRHEVYFHL